MNNSWDIIVELESDNSRLVKESIVSREATSGNHEFFAGCRLALDSMITFGVKKVPESRLNGSGLDWTKFSDAAAMLSSRQLTGHAAQDMIEGLMSLATLDQWNNWYRRILIKDLRCGVSEKTINKAVEKINADYIVPTFACQLAHDSANHEGKLAGQKLVEVKLDGVRVITVVYTDGRVLQFSRNGKELVNFSHIVEQISNVIKTKGTDKNINFVLDGEVMSSSFQDLMKQVHRKTDVQSGDAVLNVFDVIPLEDFEKGTWNTPQSVRSEMVKMWVEKYQELMPNVTCVANELVDLNTDEGKIRFKEINQRAVDGGYEGIMIKDPSAPYECKRTTSWLKLKPFIEVSLNVVDFEAGTGRNQGRLGAIICEGEDDGRRIRVNVGSGFSDANRDDFWVDRQAIIGHVAEVRADAITQNQDGTFSLRFPRFVRFRGFEKSEKL